MVLFTENLKFCSITQYGKVIQGSQKELSWKEWMLCIADETLSKKKKES